MTRITVVVPTFNEGASLVELHARLSEAVAGLGDAELIVVDDGSTDGSFQLLAELAQRDPRLRAVRLLAHHGKATALRAGFARAKGDFVITLDGDLQDDPAELPRFVAALEGGCDLVSGWKEIRHDGWPRLAASRCFNWVIGRVFDVPLHDINCGYKGYRRELLEQLPSYGELHRFVPVFARQLGARFGEIAVRHGPRRHGRSRYGLARAPKALLDFATVLLLTRYRERPLHFFAAGAATLLVGAGIATVTGAALLGSHGIPVPDWAVVALATAGVSAVSLVGFGLLAEWQLANRDVAPPPVVESPAASEPARRVASRA